MEKGNVTRKDTINLLTVLLPGKYYDNLCLPLHSRETSDMVVVADENNTRYVWTRVDAMFLKLDMKQY